MAIKRKDKAREPSHITVPVSRGASPIILTFSKKRERTISSDRRTIRSPGRLTAATRS